jgi:hypothetical protein
MLGDDHISPAEKTIAEVQFVVDDASTLFLACCLFFFWIRKEKKNRLSVPSRPQQLCWQSAMGKIFCGRLAAFWRTTSWYLWVWIPESPSIRTIRAIADADLDAFVEALATRISKFDKWAIANTKRLVNTSLPPDVELGAGWDACIASLGRSAAQDGIKALMARGFHKPGDVENRLGYYLSQIPR